MVTGSRAEYGHAYWLLKEIKEDSSLQLQIVVTGMHLSAEFGSTYRIIEKDGFRIDRKVNILRYANTDIGIAKTIGVGCGLFAQTFSFLKPDIILVFGDRYEILSAVIAAYLAKIPIAHVHGGETSQGVADEAFRHAITKMAGIHFTAAEPYRKRVVQLGENPKRVFNYGAPGLDNLFKLELLTRRELAEALNFDLDENFALVTYHPVTLEKNTVGCQIFNLLKTLDDFDFKVVFTKANADAQGEIINKEIDRFCRKNPAKYKTFDNLGQVRYFSCLRYCDLMIGNSSSGIAEAPSFKLPVVNIGDRQRGRIKAENIIDAGYCVNEIKSGIKKACSSRFKKSIQSVKNPYCKYNDGRASRRIKDRLKKIKLDETIIKKTFYDINK